MKKILRKQLKIKKHLGTSFKLKIQPRLEKSDTLCEALVEQFNKNFDKYFATFGVQAKDK